MTERSGRWSAVSTSIKKFNHASQAYRQRAPASKPFIYSAALEKGFTAATVINDAAVIDAAETRLSALGTEEFDATYDGPIGVRR
jgi:penicillin-binding protein 1A